MPALHPLENEVIAGLKRQVQMRHQPAFLREGVDESRIGLDRVDRRQAQPLELALDRPDLLLRPRVVRRERLPVGGRCVLLGAPRVDVACHRVIADRALERQQRVDRGRRLGPPVVEPLPVVVRAAEAVEGRSRLYRRAQARDRAAEALRSGALARLVPRLGIDRARGAEPPPEAIVAAVASRSGRPEAAVHAVLFGPPPSDDAGLVALADSLDSIVRDTLDPEVPHQ